MPEDGDPKAPGLAPSVEGKESLAPLSTGVTADDAVDVATEGIDAVVDVLVAERREVSALVRGKLSPCQFLNLNHHKLRLNLDD